MVTGARGRIEGLLPLLFVAQESMRILYVCGVGAKADTFEFEDNLSDFGGYLYFIDIRIYLVGDDPGYATAGWNGTGLIADEVM